MDNPSTSKAPRKPSTRTKKISVQDTEPGNVPRVELEKPNRRRKIPSVKSSEPGTVPRVELDDNPADMQRQIDDMKRQIQAQSESISQLSEVPSVLQSILSKLSDQPYEDDSEADNHPSDLDDIFGNNYDGNNSKIINIF
ncbi:unnamed protein product [Orchesella dallaii]|uniref:Uncharacterized protein n=1 Tax=Orchesella dallaii TaxID=48710 RepID=A0ABP1QS51_9HEXA